MPRENSGKLTKDLTSLWRICNSDVKSSFWKRSVNKAFSQDSTAYLVSLSTGIPERALWAWPLSWLLARGQRNKEERLEAEHHLPGKLCTQHYIGATVICFQPKNNTFHSNEFPHWISGESLGDWQGTAEVMRGPNQTSPVLLLNKDWVTLIFFFFRIPDNTYNSIKTLIWWMTPVSIQILNQWNSSEAEPTSELFLVWKQTWQSTSDFLGPAKKRQRTRCPKINDCNKLSSDMKL